MDTFFHEFLTLGLFREFLFSRVQRIPVQKFPSTNIKSSPPVRPSFILSFLPSVLPSFVCLWERGYFRVQPITLSRMLRILNTLAQMITIT